MAFGVQLFLKHKGTIFLNSNMYDMSLGNTFRGNTFGVNTFVGIMF